MHDSQGLRNGQAGYILYGPVGVDVQMPPGIDKEVEESSGQEPREASEICIPDA